MNANPNPEITRLNWGLISYAEAWERQKALQAEIVEIKLANRTRSEQQPTPNYFVVCEHPPVITMGKSGAESNLLFNEAALAERGIDFFHIERGGDVTFHGPGQIVGYPILDLENFFTDLSRYLRSLEQGIINALAEYDILGDRYPGYTGVWLDPTNHRARKIAAMGIKCSRWVTMHGFAFNHSTDLRYFDFIIPCGIVGKGVTSLERELGEKTPAFAEFSDKICLHIIRELGGKLCE